MSVRSNLLAFLRRLLSLLALLLLSLHLFPKLVLFGQQATTTSDFFILGMFFHTEDRSRLNPFTVDRSLP